MEEWEERRPQKEDLPNIPAFQYSNSQPPRPLRLCGESKYLYALLMNGYLFLK
jgi:hypothetical protein